MVSIQRQYASGSFDFLKPIISFDTQQHVWFPEHPKQSGQTVKQLEMQQAKPNTGVRSKTSTSPVSGFFTVRAIVSAIIYDSIYYIQFYRNSRDFDRKFILYVGMSCTQWIVWKKLRNGRKKERKDSLHHTVQWQFSMQSYRQCTSTSICSECI